MNYFIIVLVEFYFAVLISMKSPSKMKIMIGPVPSIFEVQYIRETFENKAYWRPDRRKNISSRSFQWIGQVAWW